MVGGYGEPEAVWQRAATWTRLQNPVAEVLFCVPDTVTPPVLPIGMSLLRYEGSHANTATERSADRWHNIFKTILDDKRWGVYLFVTPSCATCASRLDLRGLFESARDGVYVGGSVYPNTTEPRFKGQNFLQAPILMNRPGLQKLTETVTGLLNEDANCEFGFADRLMGYACERAEIAPVNFRQLGITLPIDKIQDSVNDFHIALPSIRFLSDLPAVTDAEAKNRIIEKANEFIPRLGGGDEKGCEVTADEFQRRIIAMLNATTNLGDVPTTAVMPPRTPLARAISGCSWTLVTCLFDLRRVALGVEKKAHQSSGTRSPAFYLKREKVVSLRQNMVIFCDADTYPALWQKRRRLGLLDRTMFQVTTVDNLPGPCPRLYDRIVANRLLRPQADEYDQNNRNTPGWFVLVASKYSMMQAAMQSNPFDSTHFAWIDFGIEHAADVNPNLVDAALGRWRDRASFCYINYRAKSLVQDPARWYGVPGCPGLCGIAGNFWTGRRDWLSKVCAAAEREFIRVVLAGYGHHDEQLVTTVEADHPEWFDVYFGDYRSVLSNYNGIEEDFKSIEEYFLKNCQAVNDNPQLLTRVCDQLYDAHARDTKRFVDQVGQARTDEILAIHAELHPAPVPADSSKPEQSKAHADATPTTTPVPTNQTAVATAETTNQRAICDEILVWPK